MNARALTPDLLERIDAYWRAAKYLSVGQIYLYDNPLLKRPLTLADVKHMLLGHWGTTPGQNFIYVHLNRVINKYDLDMIYVSGPGHGGPAVVGNTYLEGTYSEIYPDISQDEAGLRNGNTERPRWPMIVLNSPKGWTGPKVVDGLQIEGTFRAHQVPLSDPSTHPEHLELLEDWLRSYRPQELFDAQGRLKPELAELAPKGERRMGANPHANGGSLLRDLRMPDLRDYAADVPSPGVRGIGDTHVLGRFLRDVAKLNCEQRNFRVFGPDETLSNGLEALFDVTQRQWNAGTVPGDEFLAPTGRVMEMLSEHQCEGWLARASASGSGRATTRPLPRTS